MKNFPFEYEGKTLWYSRSIATSSFIFAYNIDQELHVLLTKRAPTVESSPGKWSVPGGFLDFDEDLTRCAQREVEEETGLIISRLLYNFWNINSIPTLHERQTVSVMYYVVLPGFVEDYSNLSPDNVEITEIAWVPISMIMNGDFDCAFNNKDIIIDIYNKLFVKSHI